MYLKSLELHGFKTFAQKTVFDFGPGITAIVGPNGVGKSNIADAVMWVLGEQSMKTLRSSSARDVIFAGTDGRRPLGLAQVSLTVDNSDGSLPIDFSEVTVSRRIFRSGDTEYRLNKAKCRLRDILELFLDTGIGKQAYSVLTQGQVDLVLSLRGEDRRELLDEVAGVQKYRRRRRETMRKLEGTEANIVRLNDIVAELTSQREPLAREAERAREHKQLTEELHGLELALLVAEHQRHRERLGRFAHEHQVAEADVAGTRAQVSKLATEHEKLQTQTATVAEKLQRLRDEATRNESQAERADAEKALAEERLRSLNERRELLKQRIAASRRRVQSLGEQADGMRGEQEERGQAAADARARLAEVEERMAQARAAAQERTDAVEELRQRHMDLAGQAVAAQSEKQSLEALEDELTERSRRIGARLERLRENRDALKDKLGSVREELDHTEQALDALQSATTDDRRALLAAQKLAAEQDEKRTVMERYVSSLESTLTILREVVACTDGAGNGVAAVLKAREEGKLSGLQGPIADLIEVAERYELAIEAALGDRLHWLIADGHEEAIRAVQFLKQTRQGRATFLALATLAPMSSPVSATLAGAEEGVVGLASRLIKFPRHLRRVFDLLLGDVIVTADLEVAQRLHKRHLASARFVTLMGERLEKGGVIAGGLQPEGSRSAVGRARDIAALEQELEIARPSLRRMQRITDACVTEMTRLTEFVEKREAEIVALQGTCAGMARDADHLSAQLTQIEESLQVLGRDGDATEARLQETKQEQQERGEDARRLQAEADAMGADVEAAQQAIGESREAADSESDELTTFRVALAEAEEQVRSSDSALERLQEQVAELAQEAEQAEAELTGLDDTEEQIRAAAQEQETTAAGKREAAADVRAKLLEQEEAVRTLNEQMEEVAASRSGLQESLEGLQNRVHRAELGRAREEAELNHIRERLQEAYELTPDDAARHCTADIKRREVSRQVRDLKARLRDMGVVNVGAIEEYERLKAREDFLVGQREDMEKAKADLLEIMQQIDEATTGAFMEAFGAVAREFDGLFKELFGGGRTELVLTDPENVLETGVEVIVQLPGKRQQNLLLLSGGERALTATALLFAMMKVRPSPFCVVDEVDAALDDENIQRFARVLREFARDSQFIVITHNKGTMEVADRLVGVTMGEPGISTSIAVELRDAIEAAERERAAAKASTN
ncbi:MAG: chromosome segregation protein SMC [Armatimonadota bacterium]